uniref:Uncharacterized protein n=1 Tax=Arundo donax TaxID=35708 RepID=A0A0A8Z3R3_ARUDO
MLLVPTPMFIFLWSRYYQQLSLWKLFLLD